MTEYRTYTIAVDDLGQLNGKDYQPLKRLDLENPPKPIEDEKNHDPSKRETWSRGVEFLFSCIAMSVGLGNLWRFPFIAFQNGGGAFVIPYLIVLFIIGKPGYFLEMVMGQFSSRGTIKVYDCVPAMRGVGTGQVLSSLFVATYYSSIMGLTLKYLYESIFSIDLPWGHCKEDWGDCVPAVNDTANNGSSIVTNLTKSSAELYFSKEVYNETENLMQGVGNLNWNLVGFLAASWFVVFLILAKGIKSSGKASYVLAILPYIVLSIILAKALTLPGAMNGIKQFFTPQWDKLIQPSVWFAAVTQVFFSLNVYFANVIMYSSYNKFRHNIYRDANIVTTLDTCTSLLAGCSVFAILGHLAFELGVDDVTKVIKPGPGLAFISYPETIAKFKTFSRFFSILFFFMLYILGIGSNVAMTSCLVTEIKDHFKKVTNLQATAVIAVFGTILGSIYYTQGGQHILLIVDYYGATFIAFNLVIFELATFCWIYGVDRICKDIRFMLGRKIGIYWRVCWKYLTPGLSAFLVGYYYYDFEHQRNNNLGDKPYPDWAYVVGWTLALSGLIQLPAIAIYKVCTNEAPTLREKIIASFTPQQNWGPSDEKLHSEYNLFLEENK